MASTQSYTVATGVDVSIHQFTSREHESLSLFVRARLQSRPPNLRRLRAPSLAERARQSKEMCVRFEVALPRNEQEACGLESGQEGA